MTPNSNSPPILAALHSSLWLLRSQPWRTNLCTWASTVSLSVQVVICLAVTGDIVSKYSRSKRRLPGIGTTVGVWGSGKWHSLGTRPSKNWKTGFWQQAGLEVCTANKMVPRPSPASDFHCLQYSKMARKGLGDLITCTDVRGLLDTLCIDSGETMTFKLGAMSHSPHIHDSIIHIPLDRAFICLLWTIDRSRVSRLEPHRQDVFMLPLLHAELPFELIVCMLHPHVTWGGIKRRESIETLPKSNDRPDI